METEELIATWLYEAQKEMESGHPDRAPTWIDMARVLVELRRAEHLRRLQTTLGRAVEGWLIYLNQRQQN